MLTPLWGHFGTMWPPSGHRWALSADRCTIISIWGIIWAPFGGALGSFCDNFGFAFCVFFLAGFRMTFLDRFGSVFGQLLDHFGVRFGGFFDTKASRAILTPNYVLPR